MNATVRRDALCRRYPRAPRRPEPGTILSLCLSAYAIACFFAAVG